jgi:hypothetical protein
MAAKIETKMYQVFDRQGKIKGVISAAGPADCARVVRSYGFDFPVIVELAKENEKSIQFVADKKTQMEIELEKIIRQQINKFKLITGVPIKSVEISIGKDLFEEEESIINIEVTLDINGVHADSFDIAMDQLLDKKGD